MNDVGEFVSATPEWDVGDRFTTGDGRRLRIVDMLETADDVRVYGAWVVEPVDR
jgi:hypothetical protein